ncbi:MAG: hypothetical protein H8E28_15760 [Anaerolineae bacterium]|nr:hypothetical protein [Anaerolineae bacterium]MBL6966255.1 hypothetical protein [Anaerolineales bacterium]
MPLSEERKQILGMIDQGIISAEEGFNLLQALNAEPDKRDSSGVDSATEAKILPDDIRDTENMAPDPEEIARWKRWWLIPLYVGAGVTALSGLLMYWAWSATGIGFWFACTWMPFFVGVLLMALSWSSQTSPWLHVRVKQKAGEKPQRVSISFPLPIRLSAWGLRNFGHFIPNIDATGLDEVILALGDSKTEDTPLFVDVSEGDDGERVQVFIG